MTRPIVGVTRVASATLIGALVTGCGGNQSPLNPAGDQAHGVLSLFGLMGWVCGIAYACVLGFLAWSLWRARGRLGTSDRPDCGAAEDPAGRSLDRGLVAWGALIVVGVAVLAVASFFTDRGFAQARDAESLEVQVTGHQWWWRIRYRDPAGDGWVETANELHLPAGRTARISLASADVIHSFWVPNVGGKMDMIPGRTNVVDVTPRREGWFRGQCAEFCGPQHAHMAFDVKVDSAADFDAWLARERSPAAAPADPTLARGKQIVSSGQCAMCHVVRGTDAGGRPGPDLTHVGGRKSIAAGALPMTRGGLQGWIAQPQALKPGTLMPPVALAPADADAVSRYLESLR